MFERVALAAARAGDRSIQADAELGWGEALCHLDGRESESLVHFNRTAVLGEHTTIVALAWFAIGGVWRFYEDADRALSAFTRSATLFMDLNNVSGELIAGKTLEQLLVDKLLEAIAIAPSTRAAVDTIISSAQSAVKWLPQALDNIARFGAGLEEPARELRMALVNALSGPFQRWRQAG